MADRTPEEKAAAIAEKIKRGKAFLADAPPFRDWPKIARLNRDVVITEKIDGTNGAIHTAASMMFKATILKDGEWKGKQ